jgi:hypothetical protein
VRLAVGTSKTCVLLQPSSLQQVPASERADLGEQRLGHVFSYLVRRAAVSGAGADPCRGGPSENMAGHGAEDDRDEGDGERIEDRSVPDEHRPDERASKHSGDGDQAAARFGARAAGAAPRGGTSGGVPATGRPTQHWGCAGWGAAAPRHSRIDA